MEGLPTKDIIDNMNYGNFHIIILDDVMEMIVKSLDTRNLYHLLNIIQILAAHVIEQYELC